MIIYLDVLFLLHVIVHYVIYSLFHAIWHQEVIGRKLWVLVLCTAFVQTVQSVMLTSMHTDVWILIGGTLLQEGLLIRFYQLKGWRQIVRANLTLLVCTILLGGVLLSVSQTAIGAKCMNYALERPFVFVVLVMGNAMLIKAGLVWYRRCHHIAAYVCPIRMTLLGQDIVGNGYLDTGNLLREPITQKPVIVGTYAYFRQYMPDDYQEILDTYFDKEVLDYERLVEMGITGLKLLSCSSVGAKEKKLPMLTIDKISYQRDGSWVHREKVYIAFSNLPLSANGEFNVLLHVDL